ncbi:MAG: tRNA pseudouridine(55) synthase TruB [Sporolactobacillus sp.]|uniref:tRNA pseudouridine(55) synthase TruB n=1 Tax=Sporolactobacillus sp. STSJ-5 TaxID=2965076 RepID=UPI0021054541|nr:tRNA pseudouridine(55) synthase TruB [Sporolactobacillus sp. STSJ-5]MCQ2008993.1 tRNA pseudouridine(55) synthase TruB [Sporolactobacillus sp. STSJ-5]
MPEYNGLLPLFKPRGMTSHDCVFRLRKMLGFRKIGHTGTLDPEVDGVLVLCLGRATKIAQYLLDFSKAYQGVIRLGTSTTTEDASGDVIAHRPVERRFDRTEIEQVMHSFLGEIEQSAPMYSAVKVNGKKLYEYARAGIDVTPPVRKVTIYQFEVDSEEASFSTDLPFKVMSSKGTYIRTLAVAVGEKLGYPAHLHRMTRSQAGPFSIDDCLTFEQIEQLLEGKKFNEALRPLEHGLSLMNRWVVDEKLSAKIAHGAVLKAPADFGEGPHAVFNEQNECLAIYRLHPEKPGMIKPDKVLANDAMV